MSNLERIGNEKTNLMTSFTKQYLLEQKKQIEQEIKEAKLAIGEGAGSESDWHDNPAFELANQQYDMASLKLAIIKEQLSNTIIIKPRMETDRINIGNTIIVKFEDNNETETFTLLGPNDAILNSDWISFESPLGKELLNKKRNDKLSFCVDNHTSNVQIIQILEGQFE
jgi:transcription elongation factor GreA